MPALREGRAGDQAGLARAEVTGSRFRRFRSVQVPGFRSRPKPHAVRTTATPSKRGPTDARLRRHRTFVGWQRQAERRIDPGAARGCAGARSTAAPVTVHGAGRTDAGRPRAGAGRQRRARPRRTRRDAIQRGAERGPARRRARARRREMRRPASTRGSARQARSTSTGSSNAPFVSPFLRRYAWHVPQPLDLEAMRARPRGARRPARLRGVSGHRQRGRDHPGDCRLDRMARRRAGRRRARSSSRITGDGFLRHMVRSIVGTLVEVGLGRWPPARCRAILASRDRARAGARRRRRGCSWCACATDRELLYNAK